MQRRDAIRRRVKVKAIGFLHEFGIPSSLAWFDPVSGGCPKAGRIKKGVIGEGKAQ